MGLKLIPLYNNNNPYKDMFKPYLSKFMDYCESFEWGSLERCRKNYIPESVGNSKDYVSDIIGSSYESWKKGKSVFITSPPATGKTYFCFEVLLKYFKNKGYSFIYICNRTNLKKQVLKNLKDYWHMETDDIINLIKVGGIPENENGVYLTTYQKLCRLYRDNKKYRENLFDNKKVIIIADEIHFLTQDASFNRDVNYFLDGLLNQFGNNSIRVYMTGTISDVLPIIINKSYKNGELVYNLYPYVFDDFAREQRSICNDGKTFYPSLRKIYTLKSDYNNIKFHFYKEDADIEDVMSNASSDNKVMYFVKSKEQGRECANKLKNSVFLFSDSTGDMLGDCEKKELKKISLEEKFSSDILITTSLLDNGINIKDSKLKTLIIDNSDPVQIAQMIGRKRIDRKAENPQKFDVYIRMLSKEDISFELCKIDKVLKEFDYIDGMGIKYLKNITNESNLNLWFIKDDCVSPNLLYKKKIANLKEYYREMEEKYEEDENIFAKTIFEIFGLTDFDELENICGNDKVTLLKRDLTEFLDKYMDSSLTQSLRDEFAINLKEICNKYDYFPSDKRDSKMNDNSIKNLLRNLGLAYEFESNEKTWGINKKD